MSTKLSLQRCPCEHPACTSYHVRGLHFGDRGLLPKDQAEELVRRYNSFPVLLKALLEIEKIQGPAWVPIYVRIVRAALAAIQEEPK